MKVSTVVSRKCVGKQSDKDEANFLESWATEIDSWAAVLSDSQQQQMEDKNDKGKSIFSKLW